MVCVSEKRKTLKRLRVLIQITVQNGIGTLEQYPYSLPVSLKLALKCSGLIWDTLCLICPFHTRCLVLTANLSSDNEDEHHPVYLGEELQPTNFCQQRIQSRHRQ